MLSNRQSRRPDPIRSGYLLPRADLAPTTTDYATCIAGLPRVLAAAATVFRDVHGRVLLIEPNYRDSWALPDS
ncbi:hypothetical protein ACFRQM_12955 [Streptomyces sp. NPDC056831]|uniref:hypothetical protein n=1 Tax=Streptomyces sp. NPDC056831 TaxID=3345954 RepID=UPI003690618E